MRRARYVRKHTAEAKIEKRIARAGPLPKLMPPSLETMDLTSNKFTGGIPSEWGSLTNLKELKLAACGLDGAWRVVCAHIPRRSQSRWKPNFARSHE